MKLFSKIALVSAMAISANAMALESMDDEALSAATGQDGITISLAGAVSMDYLAIVDGDGLGNNNGVTTSGTGAIVIGNNSGLSLTGANGIDLIIDSDNNGNAPVLNIAVNTGDLTIAGVDISVAGSDATGATLNNVTEVLDLGTITLSGLTTNIQLGNSPQGALIALDSTITNGLNISNLELSGPNGSIGLGSVTVTDAGANDLTLDLNIDAVSNTGLVITGLTAMDVAASALNLGGGSAANVGAMYISNLNVGSSVTISGH